jgi:23S rRNA (adenine-N6)-dimethyltransferase
MARLYTHAQHFLSGPTLVAELIGHSNVRKNDVIYDLGAGSGVISSVLSRRCKQVIAVENEPMALKKLKLNMQSHDNVTILQCGILDVALPSTPYKIFSNIPFSISAQVVRKFTEADIPPSAMYLIVQKQFARKLVEGDDHFTSQLGAQLGPRFAARIRRPLRRTDFTPPPAVDTVLLELKRREQSLLPESELSSYREYVGRCFAEQKFFATTPRARSGISPKLIPSQLTLDQWCALWTNVKN